VDDCDRMASYSVMWASTERLMIRVVHERALEGHSRRGGTAYVAERASVLQRCFPKPKEGWSRKWREYL
jgi:hypothetical protein